MPANNAPNGPPPYSTGPASAPAPATSATSGQPMSNQNLNQIVTDYLLKRGFTKTESVFRKESSNLGPDGRPIHSSGKEEGPKRFRKAFDLLREWVTNSLDIYKFELSKFLWPVFVYSWLELIKADYMDEARSFLNGLKSHFESTYHDDLEIFGTIAIPQHANENAVIKLYRENKYRIPVNEYAAGALFHFLEQENDNGGSVIISILQDYCQVDVTKRGPIDQFSFEAIYRRSQNLDVDDVDLMEGIPGHLAGLTNKSLLDCKSVLTLGPMPMDLELREDVRAELEEEDRRNPPPDGKPALVDEFDRKIKREESADAPNRADIPLPPSRARDVVMEMQKVRENRDRFKIDDRNGGVGALVSACMFTFHNALGSVSCMDFSKDHELVAVGTTDSYIRVWSIKGKTLKSKLPNEKDLKVNNRKLIGHSGPVYSVAFSDAITNLDNPPFGDEGRGNKDGLETGPKLLLSCSADGTVRLWSLEFWSCLCIYKGHEGPVLKVDWGPHGHYFLSGGWDKTARIWMQDHASAQRVLVGHDTSISAIAWHPNGTYVFTASDETDKSIRMWSVVKGETVRVFTGHTDYISAIECGPNGKILASADVGGNIFFWDIAKGIRIKRSRGHGRGGIWSLSFNVEENVLASGGQDGTVRLWDVELPADGQKGVAQQQGAQLAQEGGDSIIAAGAQAGGTGVGAGGQNQPVAQSVPTGGTGKKKGKEVMITPDQISAFATKKTPVQKVQFTRMNLLIAGGCFDPDR